MTDKWHKDLWFSFRLTLVLVIGGALAVVSILGLVPFCLVPALFSEGNFKRNFERNCYKYLEVLENWAGKG